MTRIELDFEGAQQEQLQWVYAVTGTGTASEPNETKGHYINAATGALFPEFLPPDLWGPWGADAVSPDPRTVQDVAYGAQQYLYWTEDYATAKADALKEAKESGAAIVWKAERAGPVSLTPDEWGDFSAPVIWDAF